MNICPLCKLRVIGSKKSHIIPKMFRNELGGDKSKIKIFSTTTANPFEHKTEQDIPKEQYLLCDECEHNLSVLEGYFANNIYRKLHDYDQNSNFIVRRTKNKFSKGLSSIDTDIICLFFQSIIWRQSITNISSFSDFQLTAEIAEELREQLNHILTDNQKGLIQDIERSRGDFIFYPFKMWTHTKKIQEDNFVAAIPNLENKYFLMMNDVRVIMTRSLRHIKQKRGSYTIRRTKVLFIEYKPDSKWRHESLEVIMKPTSYINSI